MFCTLLIIVSFSIFQPEETPIFKTPVNAKHNLTFYLTYQNIRRLSYHALFGGSDDWFEMMIKTGEKDTMEFFMKNKQ